MAPTPDPESSDSSSSSSDSSDDSNKRVGCCSCFMDLFRPKKHQNHSATSVTITPGAEDQLRREQRPGNRHSKLYHEAYDKGPKKVKEGTHIPLEELDNPFYVKAPAGLKGQGHHRSRKPQQSESKTPSAPGSP